MVTVTSHRCEDWVHVGPRWAELSAACDGSVFLSAEWVGVWLEIFGKAMGTEILLVEEGSNLIGACLISHYKGGLAWLPLRRVSLNASGEAHTETTYVEYNDILCRPGSETAVRRALIGRISQMEWDELRLEGFIPEGCYEAICEAFKGLQRTEIKHPSYYVDLAAIRRSAGTYDSALRGATRKHLRQNIRYCGEAGELQLTVARDVTTALGIFDEMAGASRIRHEALGGRSVFLSERFAEFHRRMIERYLATGLVQMLRLTAGGQTVGNIYNLVYRGRAYFYQCGYRYTSDKRLSPGTVTLSFAVQHCLDNGLDDFDFLSGDAHYKQSMSTGSRDLVWTVLRRKTLKNSVMNGLRSVRRRLQESQS